MKRDRALFLGIAIVAAGMLWASGSGAQRSPSNSTAGSGQKPGATNPSAVPPYYKSEKEAKPFPSLLSPDVFRAYPVVAKAYRIANEIPGVIAQQPCYCWCEPKFRHKSLLDCYASDHGAG